MNFNQLLLKVKQDTGTLIWECEEKLSFLHSLLSNITNKVLYMYLLMKRNLKKFHDRYISLLNEWINASPLLCEKCIVNFKNVKLNVEGLQMFQTWNTLYDIHGFVFTIWFKFNYSHKIENGEIGFEMWWKRSPSFYYLLFLSLHIIIALLG